MKYWAALLGGAAVIYAAPAVAGEEVLYQPAPDWIAHADLPPAKPGPPLVLYDDQRRIEEGRLWSYVDRAVRIDNPQMMTMAGTLQAGWLPDKGDLIVHRIAIIRDGEEIDVLAQGLRMEVLRREQQLEQRMLDGARTATLAVPGLRVGDVLRASYSVTTSDQALDKEVQATAGLPTEPFDAGFARVRLSWPENSDVHWQASKGLDLGQPVVQGGFATIEVELPLAKLPDIPQDAPLRYRMPPMLQAGTFADWQEVSRVMAPLFSTEGAIAADSPVAREVARIEAGADEPLERAVAALRLVQDEIAYMLNGMEGGNYIPQTVAETWDKRYGDCKAKTLLLLAMLREMGIEAEAVVVASQIGDAVPGMLPMPAAFDHVIVHATIDGTDYWLDGTSSGASMQVVDDVPPFHVALPLREQGADLVEMARRPQKSFDQLMRITLDHRAGLDVPMLYQAEWTLTGASAAPFRGVIGQAAEEQLDDYIQGFADEQLGASSVIDSDISYDADSNTATVKVSGLTPSPWQWERGVGTRTFTLPTQGFQFRPDRARAAWRDIPVAMPGPYAQRNEVTVLLPESGQDYALQGEQTFSTDLANVRLQRETTLEDGKLTIVDSAAWPGGEIAPGQVAAERQKAARFGTPQLVLRAPADALRRYASAARTDRKRFAEIEAAFATMIEHDPEDLSNYRFRSLFRTMTWDWPGALVDLDTVIEQEPTAYDYLQRSALLSETGKLDGALADAEAAWELDPSIQAVFARAGILPFLGRAEDAIALLEEQRGDANEERAIEMSISNLEAQLGRKEEGLQRLDALLADRPNDPDMLNAKCWYQATWNYRSEDLVQVCTEAVEKAFFSPPVLDSRALGYYRLGRYQDALKDLEAALSVNPEQTPTLFLRGIVRKELGDREGEKDIREALARQPSLERDYARFGIEVN